MRRFVLSAVALFALGLPAGASAALTTTSPFSPGVPQAPVTSQTTTTPVLTTTTSTSTNGSFGTVDVVIIAAGVIVLIAAIAFFVWRDSTKTARHLGHAEGGLGPGTGRHQGSKTAHKSRKLSAAEKKRRKRGQAPRRR